MEKDSVNCRLIRGMLTEKEIEKVNVILNGDEYNRVLIRNPGLGSRRSQSTGNLLETNQIAPSGSRFSSGSP